MRIRAAVLLAVAIALLVLATPAGAHVELFASDPEDGGTIEEGAQEISLTFVSLDETEPVRVGVFDESGVDQVSGTPQVRPPDRGTEVLVRVRPLALGPHSVTWTATSDDGDGEASGTYTFTVVEDTGGGPTWVFLVGVVVLIAAVGAVLLRLSRRRG